MQDKKGNKSSNDRHGKSYDRNTGKNWYQKLLLSQKFLLNVVLGMVLMGIGAIILTVSGSEMLHHWEYMVHGGVGVAVLLAGLWIFSRGLRYESQLDAIRISKRNRHFGGGKKGGGKPDASKN